MEQTVDTLYRLSKYGSEPIPKDIILKIVTHISDDELVVMLQDINIDCYLDDLGQICDFRIQGIELSYQACWIKYRVDAFFKSLMNHNLGYEPPYNTCMVVDIHTLCKIMYKLTHPDSKPWSTLSDEDKYEILMKCEKLYV